MQKPFQLSEDMVKELDDGIKETLGIKETDDAVGERSSPQRLLRRDVNLQDRGSAASGSKNDITSDPINPSHYKNHPSGVECIQITEWMNFNLGNAVKYIWRAGDKGAQIDDLKKARWYLDREIARLQAVSLKEILG